MTLAIIYLTGAVCIAMFAFPFLATEWSTGLCWQEKAREVAVTIGLAALIGALWPVVILAIATLVVWDRV